MRLAVLSPQTPAELASPEFRYLASWLDLQLVEVAESFERAPTAPADFDAVLLLGSERVLITAASLRAMLAELDRRPGAVVAARPFSELAEAAEPVYTLRGFERAEAAYLDRTGGQATESIAQVALLAGSTFEALGAPADLEALRSNLGEKPLSPAGTYHEFIDYYGELRDDVLPLVPEDTRDLLEIGCARGVTGRWLGEQLGCRVSGVELNPVVAKEAAQHLHRVFVGDVTAITIDGRYDVVLATELFEHLPEAEKVLRRLGELTRPGGRIILSVPNVGHWSVVEDLIAGRWDYLPIGLLCYTHYRFFTRTTLADWIRRCGFEHFELIAQETELPERWGAPPLVPGFEIDRQSLATKGFYAVIRVD